MSTRVLVAIFMLAAAGTVYAAKVVPAYEAEKLPGPEEEVGLWETASRHENRIRNGGRALDNRVVEAYLESLAERLVGSRLDHLGIEIDFMIVAEPTLSGWVYPYGTIGGKVRVKRPGTFGVFFLLTQFANVPTRHQNRPIAPFR